ncbi:MAG: ParB N-terminal domain-containing protein [Oscillospiraceae bacterium]|jgi:ParB-like chromosome segregation protein Spo0J|nr:ParB N-terminal domain-containing protein [Oscillospiraceae bacterium]
MEIIRVKASEISPAAYNPRKTLAAGDAEYEQIKRSIEHFGMVEPIVWNRRTGNIVGGHQRYTVLCDMGIDEFDVSVIDIDELQEKSLNIALNKISGEWDDDKLSVLLEELAADADEMLASLTGFTQAELDELFMLPDADNMDDDDGETNRESGFNYQEQFGVIVICADEDEQRGVYESLTEQGLNCKVVAT